jgi:predicted Zn finger-like uncharacterized protein
MKIVSTLCAVLLWFLGAIFLLAAAHPDAVAQGKSLPRAAVGLLLILGGVLLVVFAWRAASRSASPVGEGSPGGSQQPPGPLSFKALTCPHCGGQVDASTAELGPEGTLTIKCGYCQGTFMVQEDPKW